MTTPSAWPAARPEENGWYVIQDTSWEGYTEVPLWIMQGYLTMCSETVDQLRAEDAYPTHIFVQAGVGALAGAVVGYLAQVFQQPPAKFLIMEPNNAACIFASAAAGDGRPHAVTGDLDTIMVGLACGEPQSTFLGDFTRHPLCICELRQLCGR